MKELNPIVRSVVCTALHAFNNYEKSAAARFVDYNFRLIPTYWESLKLLDGYAQMWDRDGDSPAPAID